MALPATVTTNLWPDHKNSITGPFSRLAQDAQNTSNGSHVLGFDAATQELAQSFKPTSSGPLVSVDIYLEKNTAPTDNLQVRLYDDNAGELGNLLATSQSLPGASIPGGPVFNRFIFPSPFSVVSGTTYWLRVTRSGANHTTNYYKWYMNNTNPYADGKLRVMASSGTWSDVSPASDARFKANVQLAGRYVFARDNSANKVRCYKSTDNETWTEQDSTNAPAITSTANLKSFYAVQFGNLVSVFIITSSTRLDIFNYNTTTDTWGSSAFNTTAPTFSVSVATVAPMIGAFRSPDYPAGGTVLSDYLFANNGATETVMGAPRRRIKLSRRLISDGTWNTPYDIVGSGFTPDATLPGTAVDYDLRAAFVDMTGRFHIFWTQSDDSSIHHRQFVYSNVFGTNHVLGTTPAVISNTAAYPIGQPVSFFRGGSWRMALPYVDAGVLKLMKATAGAADTPASWTGFTIAAATVETGTSNPAALVADNENGGRLFAFFVRSDGKLYYAHDQGTDTWIAEQEFRPGTKTVAGLSVQALSDAVALAYFDTSPTPDAIKYDQIEVFF